MPLATRTSWGWWADCAMVFHRRVPRLQSPLSLEAVMANGRSIPLNAPVTTDCGMATALPDWVADVDRWLMATENTRIEQVNVAVAHMDTATQQNAALVEEASAAATALSAQAQQLQLAVGEFKL